jgi:hypothetical protein
MFEQQHGDTDVQQINWLPLTLEPTQDPVWPEDEEEEIRRIRTTGKAIPELMTPSQALQTVEEIHVWLPDRLFGCMLKLGSKKFLATENFTYYGLYVPTNFSADFGITPRRLRLRLTLDDAGDAVPPLVPVACYLHPGPEITTRITNLGEFSIDLGGVVKVIKTIWPTMPDILTARTGGSIDLTKVYAKVQAAGLSSHVCDWRIADTNIAYNFNPACVVQVPNGAELAVNASLHVEARRRIAKVFYKSYYRTARPMRYVLSKANGEPVDPRRLREGTSLTLRQPGVIYADERTAYYYKSDSTAAPYRGLRRRIFRGK